MQVDVLLSQLTSREQTIMRLLYGLEETDGRTLNAKEVAAHLGVVPRTIQQAVRRALRKLRMVPDTAAPASATRSHQAASQAEKQEKRLARRAEQEAQVAGAYVRLEAQGRPITMLALAQEAQVGTTIANRYLCAQWGTVAQRLHRAYAERVPQAGSITVEQLAKAARVSERAASDFLHRQRGTVRQARSRRNSVPTSTANPGRVIVRK